MRVLIVTTMFPLISETFVSDHVTALIDKGIGVHILSQQKPNLTTVHEKVIQYDLLNKTTYYNDLTGKIPIDIFPKIIFYSKQLIFSLFHNPSNAINALKRFLNLESFPFQSLYITNEISPINKFDIIHCHFCTNSLFALKLFGSDFTNGKLITSVHGFDLTKIIKEKGKHFYEELFNKGDGFLTVNKEFKRKLINFGVRPDRVIVHHMGVDTDGVEFQPRVYQEKQKTFKILSVGRLVEKKGFHYSIVAFSKIIANNFVCTYDIIGDGPERADLEKLISNLGLEGRVTLLGWKTGKEVLNYMRDSHLFVAPSITAIDGDQEGIPVVLMEAMAVGIPVVSTYHSGIPEIIKDGISGFLVFEKDSDSISDKIKSILNGTVNIYDLCTNARRTVENKFNSKKQYNRLVEIYNELINSTDIDLYGNRRNA